MLTVFVAARSTRRKTSNELKVIGAVLAGGRSSRFGADKATAEIGGWSMIDRVITSLSQAVDEVVIVGGDAALGKGRTVSQLFDDQEHAGPWSAIASMSSRIDGDRLIVVPCDVPLIRPTSLINLRGALDHGQLAVLTSSSRIHWSICAWSMPYLSAAVREEGSGSHSLKSILEPLGPRLVHVDEIEVANVNTPDDLAEATKHLAHLDDD